MSPATTQLSPSLPEVEGDRFTLVDVASALPRRPHVSYPSRTETIRHIIVHQTQGGVLPPPLGLLREAEYFIADRGPDGSIENGRGWPGFAYTFWVPFAPLLDKRGWPIVYRCQRDWTVSNHTEGANQDGVAVAFQGRFASVERPGAGAPSAVQLAVFEPLLRHLIGRYGLGADDVLPHSHFTKPSCPGFELERRIHLLKETAR